MGEPWRKRLDGLFHGRAQRAASGQAGVDVGQHGGRGIGHRSSPSLTRSSARASDLRGPGGWVLTVPSEQSSSLAISALPGSHRHGAGPPRGPGVQGRLRARRHSSASFRGNRSGRGPEATARPKARASRPALRRRCRGPVGDDLSAHAPGLSKPPAIPGRPRRPALTPAPAPQAGSEPVSDHPNATNERAPAGRRASNVCRSRPATRPPARPVLRPHVTPRSGPGLSGWRGCGRPGPVGRARLEHAGSSSHSERRVSQVAPDEAVARASVTTGATVAETPVPVRGLLHLESAQEGRPGAHRPPYRRERAMDAGRHPGSSPRAGWTAARRRAIRSVDETASMGATRAAMRSAMLSVTAMCSDGGRRSAGTPSAPRHRRAGRSGVPSAKVAVLDQRASTMASRA